jgi:YggT family protein
MRSLLWLIDTVITLYVWLLIASAVLRPIRRILPNLGGIDVSPIILILLLYFLRKIILEISASAGVFPI